MEGGRKEGAPRARGARLGSARGVAQGATPSRPPALRSNGLRLRSRNPLLVISGRYMVSYCMRIRPHRCALRGYTLPFSY